MRKNNAKLTPFAKQLSSFTKTDGSIALAEDIWFNVDLSSTTQANPLALSAALRNMPEIQGMGSVASLRQVLEKEASNDCNYQSLLARSAA